MPVLSRDNGPRIAVEKLLAERILKLMNDAGNLRSRNPLPTCHHRKILGFIDRRKDQQPANRDVCRVVH
jgi:hypothetical protein